MQRFRQMKTLQKFAPVHASLHNHFNEERHLVDRETYKARRSAALAEGNRSPSKADVFGPRVPIGDELRLA